MVVLDEFFNVKNVDEVISDGPVIVFCSKFVAECIDIGVFALFNSEWLFFIRLCCSVGEVCVVLVALSCSVDAGAG